MTAPSCRLQLLGGQPVTDCLTGGLFENLKTEMRSDQTLKDFTEMLLIKSVYRTARLLGLHKKTRTEKPNQLQCLLLILA